MNWVILTSFGLMDTFSLTEAVKKTNSEIIGVILTSIKLWPAA